MKKYYLLLILAFTIFNSCESVPYSYRNSPVENSDNFEELMKIDEVDRKIRAAEAVNLFLNEVPEDKNAAVLIENNSTCNMVVRIVGAKNYQLPVPKMGKNYMVLPKGMYQFQAKVCNSSYNATKNLMESISIALSGN